MRDLVFLAYIAVWVGLACFVNRIPFWQPRVLQHGDLSIIPDQRPAGCMMVLFLGMGAVIGAALPMAISEWLPRNPYQWRTGGTEDLGLIGRAAMLVGGCCGAYVGFRGSWLLGGPVPHRGRPVRRSLLCQVGGLRRVLG